MRKGVARWRGVSWTQHADLQREVTATYGTASEGGWGEVEEAREGDEAGAVRTKANTRAQAWMKRGEAMYTQQAEADAKKDAAKDDVVDAEFTEVDDDKTNKKSA